MAEMFNDRKIPSAALVSGVDEAQRATMLSEFKAGRLTFLFTVDVLNEGLDIPEMNTVLFLRPTDSMTVFLQQLGRGLRHAPGKDCLTVLDFVGQAHRRYRMDTKMKALLPVQRLSIDREVEYDFPHLPAGCSIQLDRLSRQYVLDNIRINLRRLSIQVPERIHAFETESHRPLTFRNFVTYHEYEPELLLVSDTWTGWKARARLSSVPTDPDLRHLKQALVRAAFITGPVEIASLRQSLEKLRTGETQSALEALGENGVLAHYRIWGAPRQNLGIGTVEDSLRRLAQNPSIVGDLIEVLDWGESEASVRSQPIKLPFPCPLELHAQYGMRDIQAVFGRANFETPGQTGVGVFHLQEVRAYAFLITYQKTVREFSPSTMYADYPISRDLLHWESQSNTAENSETGQNIIHHQERGYTILLFARDQKKKNNCAVPYTYLGDAELVSHDSERPIKIVWRLRHSMPVEMYENNRRGG
jgi:hypothetical protein